MNTSQKKMKGNYVDGDDQNRKKTQIQNSIGVFEFHLYFKNKICKLNITTSPKNERHTGQGMLALTPAGQYVPGTHIIPEVRLLQGQ